MDRPTNSVRAWAPAGVTVALALLLLGGVAVASAAKGNPDPANSGSAEGINHAPGEAANGKARADSNAFQGSENSFDGIGNAPDQAANGKDHANSNAFKAGGRHVSPTPSPSPGGQAGLATPTPTPSPSGQTILATPTPSPTPSSTVSGTGVVADSRCFNVGTGNICYSTAGDGVRGYLYGSSFSSPPVFFADVVPESPCAANYPGYQGVTDISQFASAASHVFSSPHAIVIGAGWCSLKQGILLFQQDGLYGGLEFTEIDQNQALHFRFWYDPSGASDFSSLSAP